MSEGDIEEEKQVLLLLSQVKECQDADAPMGDPKALLGSMADALTRKVNGKSKRRKSVLAKTKQESG